MSIEINGAGVITGVDSLSTPAVTNTAGSASAPSITFTGDTNTGVYSPGADQVAISTGGSGRLFVDANGRLGIGASPALSDGGASLQLYTNGPNTSASVGNAAVTLQSVNRNANLNLGSASTGTSSIFFHDQSGLGTGNAPARIACTISEKNLLFETGGVPGSSLPQERLRITSAGLVGVGTSSPSQNLHVNSGGHTVLLVSSSFSGSTETAVRIDTVGDTSRANVYFSKSGTNRGSIIYNHSATGTSESLNFNVSGGTDKLTITGAGNVGIGTTSPGKPLTIQQPDGTSALRIQSNTAGETYDIYRSSADGILQFNGNQSTGFNGYNFSTTPSGGSLTSRLFIANGGNVGIGTTSPDYTLNVQGAVGIGKVGVSGTYNLFWAPNTVGQSVRWIRNNSGELAIGEGLTAGTNEQFRFDASGRLLVGTSSTSAAASIILQGNSSDSTAQAVIRLCRGTNTPADGAALGAIGFGDNGHASNFGSGATILAARDGGTWTQNVSQPSRLVFSTTADGASSPTERMRINSAGQVTCVQNAANTASLVLDTISSSYTTTQFLLNNYTAATTGFNFITCHSGNFAATNFRVQGNGNVQNTNNSYGAISDIKLKENIIDATSQWSDIKALQVRKYNFKEGQTHTQIGLVAQEVELVSPGLVSESPDRDEEGNDLGTVTKSVNYSVLYMKAVKALQEAMERIEQLETSNADLLARVTALESA